jgi:predicted nucleic acid-binding protein
MGRSIDTEVGAVSVTDYEPGRLTHRVFLGPKFLFAFFNTNDELHEASRALAEFTRSGDLPYRQFMVNEHALDEAATRLKKRASLRYAGLLFRAVEESDLFRFERVADETFKQAHVRFVEWDDNDASFTDFVVACHMEELDVDHIATYDRHYQLFDVVTVPHIDLS